MSDDDVNQPCPTICSACNGTHGKCQSCIKADAMIEQHPNEKARLILRAALNAMVTGTLPSNIVTPS